MSLANTHSEWRRGAQVWYQDHLKRLVYPYGAGKDVIVYHEEFVNFPTDDSTGDPTAWTSTMTETGTSSDTTFVANDVSGGGFLITTDDNENDGINAQVKAESFSLKSTNDLYFGAFGVEMSDATDSDMFIGLAVTDTTILGGVTDSIGFRKVDGSTTLSYLAEAGTSETTGTAATLANDTAVDLELYWDGTTAEWFVDGSSVGTYTSTNLPTSVEMRVSIAFLTGADAAITLKGEKIACVQIGR